MVDFKGIIGADEGLIRDVEELENMKLGLNIKVEVNDNEGRVCECGCRGFIKIKGGQYGCKKCGLLLGGGDRDYRLQGGEAVVKVM